MKRIISYFLMCCMLLCTIPAVNAQEDTCKVTFVLPEGHFYTEIHNNYRVEYVQSRTVEFKKGHVLTEEDIEPFMHHCTLDGVDPDYPIVEYNYHKFCHVTQLGWDKYPYDGELDNAVGTVIDSDMAFEAVMNDDVCTVTVKANKGFFQVFDEKYDTFTVRVDRGYTFNEEDERHMTIAFADYAVPSYSEYVFEKAEPQINGLTVNEDITITDYLLHIVHLKYYFPDLKGGYTSHAMYLYYCSIREDEELTRDTLPAFDNYKMMIDFDVDIIDAYWDISDEDLALVPKCKQSWYELYSYVLVRGDANGDTILNTKDAVTVLQHSAGMTKLEGKLLQSADANRDNKVDTADAVVMLKFAAGMISAF